MTSHALPPARIDFGGAVPRSLDFGDVYHSADGAQAQARHVFLRGNALPDRWAGRQTFCILETGFGLGHNFLAAWRAWRDDPRRCQRLHYWAVEGHPPARPDLARAHTAAEGDEAVLAEALCAAWPPLVRGLHALSFDDDRVTLWLAFGDARTHLPQCVGRFDAFFLDGFAPDRNPDLWDRRLLQSLSRLAAPGATAATWSVAGTVREALSRGGFEVERRPGFGAKKQMLAARYRPHRAPDPPAGRPPMPAHGPREAVIVGAGLAGAAVAHAMACQGWRCTVLDRGPQPACGASGNPAGLLHATTHREDSLHARLHRAGALYSARRIAPWIANGRVPGRLQGLLAVHTQQALPIDDDVDGYACRLDAAQASAAAGVPLPGPAVQYIQGGWIDPAALVRAWLDHPAITFRGGVEAARLRRDGPQWQVEDTRGLSLARAPVVVLAGGANLPSLARAAGLEDVPWQVRRGQIDWCDAGPTLRQPVTGRGYVLTLPDGRLLYGATSSEEDAPAPHLADTAWNRSRLQALIGYAPPPDAPGSGARVSHRLGTPDRLPTVGPLPLAGPRPGQGTAGRRDQVRFIPRQPGLFVCGGFGSRGLTWAALAAQVICGWLDGTPMPLEADLLDAIDPARWQVRKHRRTQADEAAERLTQEPAEPARALRQAEAAPATGPGASSVAVGADASVPS